MSAVDTIQVALESGLAKALRDSVEAGDYRSIEDAMQDAVRLWRDRRAQASLDLIRTRIERSQSDSRPSLSSQEVDDHLEALFERAEPHNQRA